MPTKKQLVAAALLSASLAGGGAVGAILGTPSLISAQETEEDTTDHGTASPEGRRDGMRRHRHLGVGLQAAAEALGLTTAELRAELSDGSSIADVAGERDVAVDPIIDAVVAEASARIDEKVAAGELDAEQGEEMKATLAARVTALVNGERPAGGFGRRGPGHHGRGVVLDAAADALGLAVEELRDELADGSSIADVAGERNIDVQTVIDAMVAEAIARLDERRAELPERITALVNGERPASEDGVGD